MNNYNYKVCASEPIPFYMFLIRKLFPYLLQSIVTHANQNGFFAELNDHIQTIPTWCGSRI